MSLFDFEELDSILENSYAVRLMRSPIAAFAISFLYKTFKQAPRTNMPRTEIEERLHNYIEGVQELTDYKFSGAKDYLNQWADEKHRLVRVYAQGEEAVSVVELTPDAERVISWVEQLAARPFIGTESRFLRIFSLLQEIVIRSVTSPEERIAQLERDKAAIQQEIDTIRETGQVKRYTAAQLRESFSEADRTARELLSDFRAIRENFKALAKQVQEEQLRPDMRKGAIISAVLDAEDKLRESDEGQSFYAFWRFLLNQNKQDEFEALLDDAFSLPDLRELTERRTILRSLIGYLVESGAQIVTSNQRLTEQLRRMLDERNLKEAQYVRKRIEEIKHAAFKLRDEAPLGEDWLEIEGLPQTELPMERQLWKPGETINLADFQAEVGNADAINLTSLFHLDSVDEERLKSQIAMLLDEALTVSLAEVIAAFPIKQGLAELLAYLTIASRREGTLIDSTATHTVFVEALQLNGEPIYQLVVKLPVIEFRKRLFAAKEV